VSSATPAVSKSLRLRANNIDVAASAEGVGAQYFNVYGMTFSEGNTLPNIDCFSSATPTIVAGILPTKITSPTTFAL
jgi:macrolide transport system ATP-binding/permease protein